MAEYVLGLDIGTTCTKAIVINNEGEIVAQSRYNYGLISNGDKVEQDAGDWIHAVIETLKDLSKTIDLKDVKGISTSTQGGTTVAVDKDGNFIGNAWTWMDGRSIEQTKAIEQSIGTDYVYKTTGWRTNAAFDPAKIMNMKSLPEFKKAVKYYTTIEIVNGFLTDNYAIDPTNAAMRQLYNIKTQTWDETILNEIGLTAEELPEIVPTGDKIGEVTERVAALTGLAKGTPVFNGAHDQYCASIGAGVINDGELLLSAGTTWVLMGISKDPLFTDSFIAPGNHPIKGLYGNIASIQGSGAALQWFNNNFVQEDFVKINAEVAKRAESANGLLFYPYLAGANYPIWQPSAKGTFTGITLAHDKYDFIRSIMEGVAFSIRKAVEDFAKNGVTINSITMMGGASKSDVWIDILTSTTNIPIVRLNQTEVCSIGAGVIAGCGIGMFKDYAQAASIIIHNDKTFRPKSSEVIRYGKKFNEYEKVWQNLSKSYV